MQRIAMAGPLTVAEFMSECLLHPVHGYYSTREPFGAAGDFTTAPEISQMFGELLGLALAQAWLDQGAPSPFVLAEVGPGRGTLMADVLRATARVPGFHEGLTLHLVEASPRLREVQAEALPVAPVFHDSVADLPDLPLFLLANEFFDALPIRQFLRRGAGWAEKVVGVSGGRLAWAQSPAAPLAELVGRLGDTREGDLVETCAAATPIMQEIAGRIARRGGAALIFDYGGWHSLGDTLQAVRQHRPIDPLETPGEADLTAHVDFEPLAAAAEAAGAQVSAMLTQGEILERLGIGQRAERLAQGLTGESLATHVSAYRRLTAPDEMGTLFKTVALSQRGGPLPPGYHDA